MNVKFLKLTALIVVGMFAGAAVAQDDAAAVEVPAGPTPQEVAAQNMRDLLSLVKQGRSRAASENRAREQRFSQDKANQQSELNRAERERAARAVGGQRPRQRPHRLHLARHARWARTQSCSSRCQVRSAHLITCLFIPVCNDHLPNGLGLWALVVHVCSRLLRAPAVFQAVRTQCLIATALLCAYHEAAVHRLA